MQFASFQDVGSYNNYSPSTPTNYQGDIPRGGKRKSLGDTESTEKVTRSVKGRFDSILKNTGIHENSRSATLDNDFKISPGHAFPFSNEDDSSHFPNQPVMYVNSIDLQEKSDSPPPLLDLDALMKLARNYHAMGKYKDAETCYSIILIFNPNDLDILTLRAACRANLVGKKNQAKKDVQEVLRKNPEHPSAILLQACFATRNFKNLAYTCRYYNMLANLLANDPATGTKAVVMRMKALDCFQKISKLVDEGKF